MPMNKNSTLRKSLNIAGNVLFYGLIVLLLLFSIANLTVKSEKDIANVFGRGFLPVLSDSMEGEDGFDKGDLLFVKIINDSEANDFSVGDVVTFYDITIAALNTHRVVEVTNSYIVTQGDKANAINPYEIAGDNTGKDYQIVAYEDVKAVHTGTWSGVGSAVNYLQTPVGFAIFIILPVVLLLAYQGFVLTKALLAVNKEKLEAKYAVDKEQSLKDLEAEKEKIRKELLEELKKEQK
ncbi:MAG: signal peptidase I [Tenericutes bacterium HGW-Tenericutes-8]|nr:MAG: signal peptidase I [Tenericutes bacterium HGW-Tenericutes-8]